LLAGFDPSGPAGKAHSATPDSLDVCKAENIGDIKDTQRKMS